MEGFLIYRDNQFVPKAFIHKPFNAISFKWNRFGIYDVKQIIFTMNQYEICAIIEDELPSVSTEIKKSSAFGNVYTIMKALTKYTRKKLALHNLSTVVKCLNLADKIYTKGNMLVKNAVETIFVFSFSRLQASCNKVEWHVIQTKMPITLPGATKAV